jgi:hypothetical protein
LSQRLSLSAADAEVVAHLVYAGNALGNVFAPPFLIPISYGARERHFAVGDVDFDFARVDVGRISQSVTHIFANPLVGALVSLRAAASEGGNASRVGWVVRGGGRTAPARVATCFASVPARGRAVFGGPAAVVGTVIAPIQTLGLAFTPSFGIVHSAAPLGVFVAEPWFLADVPTLTAISFSAVVIFMTLCHDASFARCPGDIRKVEAEDSWAGI